VSRFMSEKVVVHSSKRLVLLYVFGLIVVLAALFFVFWHYQLPYFKEIWRAVAGAGACGIVYAHLARITTVYTLDKSEITSTKGILSKRSVRVPLNRITNYEVRRTFVERLLGLGDVLVDTAGSKEFEIGMFELDRHDIDSIVKELELCLAQSKIVQNPAAV